MAASDEKEWDAFVLAHRPTWQRLEAIRDAVDPDRLLQGGLDAPAALR